MSQASDDQSTSTITVTDEEQNDQGIAAVKVTLRKPKNDKKVKWSNATVDNENMNKKKSKCCCIYDKPRNYDESSSDEEGEEDDECDHCHGHVEKKKGKHSNVELAEDPLPDAVVPD